MSSRCHVENLSHRLAWGIIVAIGLAVIGGSSPGWSDEKLVKSDDEQFWAFRKPALMQPAAVRAADRVRTPVDRFVLAELEEKGLIFSPDADLVTFVRRAYLDLIGLPPAPDEVDAFLADTEPDAADRLVDRLLASSHFGERWGRHWLDVVGYTDTVGFDIDAALIIQSEGKWRYRDYVSRSFNADKPYDRFVTEQLAGDELVDWRNAEKFTPEIRELLVATGFLRTAQDYTHEPESNIPLNHFAVLHDTLEIVGSSLLGLTLNCARCHDHKFDPIPQGDYYRLMALFTPAYNPNDWKAVTPYKPGIQDRALPDVSAAERAAIERHNAEIDAKIAESNQPLIELRRPYEQRLFEAKLATIPEPIRADTRSAIETPTDKRNEIQKYLASKFAASLKVSTDEVVAALNDPDKATNTRISEQIASLNRQRRSFGKLQALFDIGPPPTTHLLVRGNHETPGPVVPPGFLRVLSDAHNTAGIPTQASGSATSGRRTALAQWLTRRDSPAAGLLARVMVNRVWQHLLGEGLVPTPENFGSGGERPTHPELLDWLSVEFMRNEWRVKPLIKLIMNSTVYRQVSRRDHVASNLQSIDPDNRLLWHQRLRRLESEAIRDAVLAVSGTLDRQPGGPPILLEARPDGMVIISEKEPPTPTSKWRRSVYLLARHQYHLSMLTVFDQPVLATNCTRRVTSAVPLQSLTMMNDAFLFDQAEHFSARVIEAAGMSAAEQITVAFRMALGRRPSMAEMDSCQDSLKRQAELFQTENRSPQEAARKALVHLCQTLFNASEFLYVQ